MGRHLSKRSRLRQFARRLRRYVRLQRGEAAAMEGKFLQWTEQARLRFVVPRVTPLLSRRAESENAGARRASLADGVLPLLFPPEHYFTVKPLIAKGLENRDRSLAAA